jgi:hypothetical protein
MLRGSVLFLMLLFLIVSTVAAQQQLQDVVYLKDGSIIHGQIIEQVPNVSIKIQTRDGNVFTYKIESIEKMLREPAPGLGNEKSATTAFLLSFVFPGLGQYYNGQVEKGVIQEVLYVGGFVLLFTAGTKDVEKYHDSYYYSYYTRETEITTWYYVGLFTAIGSSLWSMIDAPISANKINKRSNQWGHMIESDSDNRSLGFDVGYMKRGVGAKVTLHF